VIAIVPSSLTAARPALDQAERDWFLSGKAYAL
jgi:hypothetical protein